MSARETAPIRARRALLRIMLAMLLAASAACTLMSNPLAAHATSITRQDLRTVASGGIVLDLDICDRIPTLPAGCDYKDSTFYNPQLGRNSIMRDIRYRIDIPGDSQWHTFDKTIDLRFDDCGFDADGNRIDMVYRINSGWRYSANTATSYVNLLQLWPGNPYDSSGITYGCSPWFTPDWSGASDHIKTWADNKKSTVCFYKKGTSTPATGKLFQFFSDVEGNGSTDLATGEHVFVYSYPSSWNLYLSSTSQTVFHSTAGTIHASGVGQSNASLYEKGFGCYLQNGSQFACYGGIDILNQLDPVRVTTSAGTGGKITSAGYTGSTIVVGYMGSRTLQITPDTGYHIASVKADGISKGTPSTYTFSNMTANHALAATFAANTYKVAFKPNGASNTMTDQSMTYNTAANLKASTLTRTGYAFTGWNTKADGTGTAYANKQSVKNLTATNGATVALYAQWRANTYQVAFDANGGTGTMENMAMTYDKAADLRANTFTREGYTWQRWNTSPDGMGATFTDEQSIENLTTEDGATVTLYAQWAADVQVTFQDGWGATLRTETVPSGGTATAPDDPERPGYLFIGWDGSYANVTNDEVIYAEWERICYTIAFDGNGGAGRMDDMPMEYDRGARLPACAFEKEGYRFVGWIIEGGEEGCLIDDGRFVVNLTETADEVVTLRAQWLPTTYTISFDGNGGAGAMDDLQVTIEDDAELPLCSFTRPGMSFQGWALSEDGPIALPDGAPTARLTTGESARVTLYAVWDENAPVLVTYCPDDAARTSVTHESDEVAPLSGNATGSSAYAKTGYCFDAWTDADGNLASTKASLLPARNTDGLYEAGAYIATSHPISYAIRYEGNGGSGAIPRTRCTYDEPTIIAENGFSLVGKRFAGWSSDLTGHGRVFEEGEEAVNLAATEGAEVVLYAMWENESSTAEDAAPDDGAADSSTSAQAPEEPSQGADAADDAALDEDGASDEQPQQLSLSSPLAEDGNNLISTGYAEGGGAARSLTTAGSAYDKTGDRAVWMPAAFITLIVGAAAGALLWWRARRRSGGADGEA